MNPVLLPGGSSEPSPVGPGDGQPGGTSADAIVVGAATGGPAAQLAVGSADLAATAGGGATDAPGTAAVVAALQFGSAVERHEAAGGVVGSPAPGSEAAIADASTSGDPGSGGYAGTSSNPPGALPNPSIDTGRSNAVGSRPGSGGATTDTVSVPNSGLVFNNTFQSSVTSAYQNNIITAEQSLAGLWTNSITLNLTFQGAAQGTNGDLASNSWFSVNVTYAQLTSALESHEFTSYAQAAVASLPATDPNPKGGADWSLPEAYARMLGLSSSTSSIDDTITLNTSYNWSFGQDVVNTLEHEISEGGMGRVGGLGDQNGAWSTMDLFRYSSAGVRDFFDGRDNATTYFSYNGTELSSSAGLSFNNEYTSAGFNNGGDTADFTEQDVFGTGQTGETNSLSQTDIEIMDVLGWDPTPTLVVSSGQTVTISAGLTSSGIAVQNGGTLHVASGGTASFAVLSSGGLEVVSAGGADQDAIVGSSAGQDVFGSASAVVVNGGAQIVTSGGAASATTINGGSETVSSSGTAVSTTINSGGSLTVSSGGIASGTTISGGGSLTVSAVGSAVSATINSGGRETVLSGGRASQDTINSGGSLTVSLGGSAVQDSIASGGREIVFSGGSAVSATIGSGGTETVSSGGIASATTISGSGALLHLLSGAVVSGGISFSGSGGQLQIAGTPPTGAISGFTAIGDVIDLTSLVFSGVTSVGFNPVTDVLSVAEGGTSATVQLGSGTYTGITWSATKDGGGTGTDVAVTPCYCRGTRILTDQGEVPVEDLAISDRVVTISGEAKPIRWVGWRSYDARFVAGNRAVLPIQVAAGALADGLPARDLWISPEHALHIDGLLVPARQLVNGASIVQVEAVGRIDYFHIELAAHDIIFAEGMPAETFVDCDNRWMFHNGGEFAALYPDDRRPAWEFCALRLEEASAELPAIRAALLARAEALGYRLTGDPDLHLIVDGKIVRAQAVEEAVHRFTIPAGSLVVWLASRSAVPAEVEASSQDRRQLGVALKAIVLREAGLCAEIGHGHSSLCEGFHDDEDGHRWTDGSARLPDELLRPFAGEVTIEVQLTRPGLRYPLGAPAPAAPTTASRRSALRGRVCIV